MSPARGTSSPRLAWRYALLTVLTLIVTAQLGGSLWTLTRIARGLNVSSLGFGGPILGKVDEIEWIRSEGGAVIQFVHPSSPAAAAGIVKGDVLVAVNGISLVEDPAAMARVIMRAKAGDSVQLRWRRGTEEDEASLVFEPTQEKRGAIYAGTRQIRMSTGTMIWMISGPHLLLTVPFLFAGALIGFLRPGAPVAFQTALLFLCIGVYCFVENLPGLLVWPAWVLAIAIGVTRLSLFVFPVLFLRIMAVFPNRSRLGERLGKHLWVLLLPFAVLAPACVLYGVALVYEWADRWGSYLPWFDRLGGGQSILVAALGVVGLVAWIAQRIEARGTGRTKQRLLEFGILAIMVGSIWLAFPIRGFVWKFLPPSPPGSVFPMALLLADLTGPILLIAFLPLSFAYAVLARRVFGVGILLRKGIRYLLLSRGVLVVEGLLLFLILEEAIRHGQSRLAGSVPAVAALSAVASVVVMTGLGRVNRPLMHRIDKRFFRESYDARRVLLALGESVTRLREKDEIVKRAGEAIAGTLHPSRAAVFFVGQEGAAPLPAWDSTPRIASSGGAREADFTPLASCDVSIHLLGEGAAWSDIPHEENDAGTESASATSGPFELLIAIRSSAGLSGCIALAAKLSEEPYSREDKELLVTVATQMGLALENAELLEIAKREAEQARDLAIARQVQQNLFPKQLPVAEGWEFAATCRPAKAVGGDYYDLFAIDEDHVAFAIGDVSGKGLGPSMLMSSAHTMIRSRLRQKGTLLADLVSELNEHLYASTSPEMFLTLFVGVLDVRSGCLRYVNGGHNPPMLLRASGEKPAALETGGTIVGIVPGVAFKEGEARVEHGDLLALYSDGVTEATNEKEQMFEEERLQKVLVSTMNRTAPEVVGAVLDAVDRFAEGREQADDISLVVVRRLDKRPHA
jgi:sigma-B regulation protein RsbU (phosphoserine phosphatase)